MVQKSFTILVCCLTVLFHSCEKNEIKLADKDYIIFGSYHSMCSGDCIAFYKLEENKLFKDTRTQYPPLYSDGFYTGNFAQLSQNQFEEVKDLLGYFPSDLLKESKSVIGCPDCVDYGGLYIEYNVKGVRKYWHLDRMKSEVPEKYHAFIDKVDEKIVLLRE
ncbi:hypothetical protein [uncultured Proteiniphilum sp.]|uniref:hypothetical protein n=1 Tax=uncultured Proteiniphilum sp. TaxID=497637 RepID=UPI002609DF7A|nr:hypothetical protein [uncultured Proteiniphilum sp.]